MLSTEISQVCLPSLHTSHYHLKYSISSIPASHRKQRGFSESMIFKNSHVMIPTPIWMYNSWATKHFDAEMLYFWPISDTLLKFRMLLVSLSGNWTLNTDYNSARECRDWCWACEKRTSNSSCFAWTCKSSFINLQIPTQNWIFELISYNNNNNNNNKQLYSELHIVCGQICHSWSFWKFTEWGGSGEGQRCTGTRPPTCCCPTHIFSKGDFLSVKNNFWKSSAI